MSHTCFAENVTAYAEELRDIPVSKNSPVALIRSARGDSFDVGLKLYRKGMSPLLILMDCKSSREKVTGASERGKVLPDKDQPENCAKALKGYFIEGDNLLYAFVSTHVGRSFVKDGTLVLRRDELQRFFGPAWEVYVAARALSSL